MQAINQALEPYSIWIEGLLWFGALLFTFAVTWWIQQEIARVTRRRVQPGQASDLPSTDESSVLDTLPDSMPRQRPDMQPTVTKGKPRPTTYVAPKIEL